MAHSTTPSSVLWSAPYIALGAALVAYALEILLIPNGIIDGGVIGVSILLGKLLGDHMVYPLVCILNLPFVYLAYRHISKMLLVQMVIAIGFLTLFGQLILIYHDSPYLKPYTGDLLEIVVVGGLVLGLGVGLIIKAGGCLDGTEILGLMLNKSHSVSVGQVVMGVNIFVFTLAGFVFQDWHTSVQSLITFFIAMKIMDMVIAGFDEMKSIMIFSSKSQEIKQSIMHDLNLGLTVLHGKGGFSSENREVIYLIAERLQLSAIKDVVQSIDPEAFIAIHNLHEVATSGRIKTITRKIS
jgi:uncharacterized membrane-anchored protein YitT (DUF2179 family)